MLHDETLDGTMADRRTKEDIPRNPAARLGLPDEVRAEILQAAASAFMDRGYAATSIDDVADSLGSTKGKIYHYYRSKTDIFIDVHLEALHQLLDRVGAIAARKDLAPPARIYAMCHEHVTVFMTTIAYQKATILGLNRFLLSITTTDQAEATQMVQEGRDNYERLYVEAIEDGIAAGHFSPMNARRATKPLLGALNWSNLWFDASASISAEDLEDVADTLASYCVSALLNLRAALPRG